MSKSSAPPPPPPKPPPGPPRAVTPGEAVRHARFGDGVVHDTRHRGLEALVEFAGRRFWISTRELVDAAGTPPPEPDAPLVLMAGRARARGAASLDAKRVLEAFRLGIVPPQFIGAWTVGRDRETAAIDAWLQDLAHGAVLVLGSYGAGKSHLLAFLAERALEMNYAVCKAHVDPGRASAAFPRRLYGSLVRGLRVPGAEADERGDLRTLVRRIAAANPEPGSDAAEVLGAVLAHPALGEAVSTLRAGREPDEESWWSLEAQDAAPREGALALEHTTAANIFCNTLTTLSAAAVHLAGCEGLLLLVDEVETADVVRYAYHRARGLNLLRGLVLASSDEEKLLDEDVARAPTGDSRGTQTGLVYSGHHRELRYLARLPCHLKVALAMTPGPITRAMREWQEDLPVVELPPLERVHLWQLIERVSALYGEVYGVALSATEQKLLMQWLVDGGYASTLRMFLKGVVEALDFRRFHRDQALSALVS